MTEGLSRLAPTEGWSGRSRDKSSNMSDSTRRLLLAASRLIALLGTKVKHKIFFFFIISENEQQVTFAWI